MIAHPPCTYLANSGVRWLYGGKGTTRDPKRWALMEEGARFFKMLLDADIPRIAVENPIMHGHAKIIVGEDPAQIVQPYQFGHSESKATCFWLRNLPPLRPTNILEGRHFGRVHKESPGADRWKRRSLTYTGIADAMAEQWGGFASSGKIIDSPPPIRVKIPAAELSPNVHRIATRGLG